ncbi:hypothetical protein H5410_017347 [Solanum commersonii]|uniref:Uncharacterized protein n=1 Tax=Solanum commersonii TaxID=4109 RepID=A0A9J5ZZP3_SOLCO|nr:hypothetical protein H5410_017347 [Solanum commersonii]
MSHFGRLDHLVNNAGMTSVSLFEEIEDITNMRSIMDINFWGSVYMKRFAIPYLRYSEGRIIVLSSAASWMPAPRISLYSASKAAMVLFFEALRIEFGRDIKITLVTAGFVESEMTQGKFIDKTGKVDVNPQMRDVEVGLTPVMKVEDCAKAIVNGACRGERYITVPSWFRVTYLWKVLCPDVVEWFLRLLYLSGWGASPEDAPSKKILDYTSVQKVLYPENIRELEPKTYILSILSTVYSEDVAGKVVVITGASSGIGERCMLNHCSQKEKSLSEVAERALDLGALDDLVIPADGSKVEDCRRIVDRTIMDHLVNNAGVIAVSLFEEIEDITNVTSILDINFWGSIYMTKFAISYLRRSEGRIIVLSSAASWIPAPRMSLYR